jgi:hypothetical protein
MCIVALNRTTAACGHAYFQLTKPCQPTASLASCPTKISIAGWESRVDACAFCSGAASLDGASYRLLGYEDAAVGPGSLSRTNSLSTMTTSSMTSARRDSRRGSLARSDSSTGSAGTGTGTGAYAMGYTSAAGGAILFNTPNGAATSDRNIHRNQRIDTYLSELPENVYLAGRKGTRSEGDSTGAGTVGRLTRTDSTSSGGGTSGVDAYAGAAKKFAKDKKKSFSRDLKGWLG